MDPLSRPAGQLALENEPGGRATLRARQTPRSERRKIGKGLRKRVARSSLGDWTPPPDRRDPVDQVNTAKISSANKSDCGSRVRFVYVASL